MASATASLIADLISEVRLPELVCSVGVTTALCGAEPDEAGLPQAFGGGGNSLRLYEGARIGCLASAAAATAPPFVAGAAFLAAIMCWQDGSLAA